MKRTTSLNQRHINRLVNGVCSLTMIEASLRAAKTNNYAITHHVPTTPKGVCVCVCWGGGGWGRKGGGLDRCNSFRPNQIRLWASGCEYRCVSVTFPFHHYIQIFEQKTALCKETGLDRKSWSSVCYIKPIFI